MDEIRTVDRPRRLAVLAVVALGISVASSCRCAGKHEGAGPTPTSAPISSGITAGPPVILTVTPAPATGVLHAWANPLGIAGVGLDFADHTWVSSYDAPSSCVPPSEYWYSWGGCHGTGPGTTARDLGRAPADLRIARCICRPDLEDYQPTPGNPAHGGIDFYGVNGVCHQLSNRILFATSPSGGSPAATVSGAHGYWFSRFLYGTYGANSAEWAARKARCLAPPGPPPTAAAIPITATAMRTAASSIAALDADLAAMFDERFNRDYSRAALAQIVELRHELLAEKAALDAAVLRGAMRPRLYALEVNRLLNRYLPRAAEILGPDGYRRLFGAPPGTNVGVVDPEIAAKSNYGVG